MVTNRLIEIRYFKWDITQALLSFDRLRWHRSRSGPHGFYEPRTAAVAAPAVLTGSRTFPHQVTGRVLRFRVGGTAEVAVTFVGPDPVMTESLVAQVNAATDLVIASDANGALRLTTDGVGGQTALEILDGDANPFLGWSAGDAALGTDLDDVLLPGVHEYFYTDPHSHEDYWYQAELFHSSTGARKLSVPFPADAADAVPKEHTITAYLRLADQGGRALAGRKVSFFNLGMPNAVEVPEGRWGVARQFAQITTDRNGYAQIRLLRGVLVDVNIEGGITRRITVPVDGSAVDLLDPDLVAQDEFGVQASNVPFAVRTT
jgi:hypothetical protein